MYTEKEIVRIAKRENNTKRNYLVMNSFQAKHIPTSARCTWKMFDELAECVKNAYPTEKLLVIGFAETATAIGARLAVTMKCKMMQTTREIIDHVEYLFFTESHSHAMEQKVIKNDLDFVINDIDRIIFAEDEVTTGNTIMKIIDLIKNSYEKEVKFGIASILNGMNEEAMNKYTERNIGIHYLVKTNHANYIEVAEQYNCDGTYIFEYTDVICEEMVCLQGYVNGRRLTDGEVYQNACENLWKQIQEKDMLLSAKSCLVMGTEECMYPAIFVAEQIEKLGIEVKCHSTTRSPIAVSKNSQYPVHCRYELRSMYDSSRRTFIYDIDTYDCVMVITDAADEDGKGRADLCAALAMNGNKNITIIRWM